MRDAEALLHRAGKVLHGHRCGERPHTPDALGDAVLPARDDEGGELFEAEMRGEHIVHAAMRRIEVRMCRCDGDAVCEEGSEPAAEREVGAQLLHTAEDRGMMRNDHVRFALNRFLGDSVVHVERDENAPDLLREAPNEEARVIPVLCQMTRRNALKGIHDDLTAEHRNLLYLYIGSPPSRPGRLWLGRAAQHQ